MTKPGIKLTLLLLASILILQYKGLCQGTNSQLSKPVTGFLDPVYGVDQRLISGTFYYGPPRGSISGSAYFIDESWKKGTVTIGKLSYHDLDLKYDIEKNKIVLKFANIQGAVWQISLKKDNINNFVMNGRLFVPFPGSNKYDTAKFCEVIVSGEINYIILKSKFLTILKGGITDYEYKEYIKQFLYINNQLIPFRSRRVIYHLYPEHKQELKRYLRSQRLYPMKNRIRDREAMIKYCNQLISDQN